VLPAVPPLLVEELEPPLLDVWVLDVAPPVEEVVAVPAGCPVEPAVPALVGVLVAVPLLVPPPLALGSIRARGRYMSGSSVSVSGARRSARAWAVATVPAFVEADVAVEGTD
jgi:hypothetical protein